MIKYRLATKDDMTSIVNVHKKCFPDSFSSTLGNGVLKEYYMSYYDQHRLFIIAEENDQIIGFCMGYESGSKAYSLFINKERINLVLSILKGLLCFNKITWKKLVTTCYNIINKPKPIIYETITHAHKYGDLLSICVLDKYRGQGVAKQLVYEFEKLLVENNLFDYYLSLLPDNHRALRFYELCGMRKISETRNILVMYKKIQ